MSDLKFYKKQLAKLGRNFKQLDPAILEDFEVQNNTVAFYYDTDVEPTSDQINQILEAFKSETGVDIKLQVLGNRFFFGGDSDFMMHIYLDVAESLVKNIVGKNPDNLKSELIVVSNEGYTVQPCFYLTDRISGDDISEINRLYTFVTGIKGIGYFNENRFDIDTQQERMQHGELDVAELLVRRTIEPLDIEVKDGVHGFKALPSKGNKNKGFFLTNKQPQISAAVERGLRNKVEEHNEEHGDDPAKRATYGMLAECFRRGIGAYNTNPGSVRPSVTSADQWAYARVNALLYALRNGRFRGGRFDTDLLPVDHPLSSKEKDQKQEYSGYPQSATNNARRMLDWIEEYGRDEVQGGTQTGLARARQIAERRPLDRATINRIYSFFSRHDGNQEISEENRDTPWRDNGFVAWNLWGGTSMFNYVRDIVESKD